MEQWPKRCIAKTVVIFVVDAAIDKNRMDGKRFRNLFTLTEFLPAALREVCTTHPEFLRENVLIGLFFKIAFQCRHQSAVALPQRDRTIFFLQLKRKAVRDQD